MTDYKMLFAGFGGQGILFAGKVAVNAGLCEEKQVSWLPSYGPEMRGGTANCSVCISDDPIGSPLVTAPNILMAMSQPSYEKFIDKVLPGSVVFLDSTLIQAKKFRQDVNVIQIPATKLAEYHRLNGLANMVILGKLFSTARFCSEKNLLKGLENCIPPAKRHFIQANQKALQVGMDYESEKRFDPWD